MKITQYFLPLLAISALTASSHATAATIDFNALSGSDLVARGSLYQEDGFQLRATRSNGSAGDFRSIHPGDSRYTGTVSFLNNIANGITTLSQIGGAAFTLNSIDLTTVNNLTSAVTVSFTANVFGGGSVSQAFTTDTLFPGLQTFNFNSSFQNVTSVRWTQASPYHSFDNIVVNRSTVPEPASLALLGLGFAGMRLVRRKAL